MVIVKKSKLYLVFNFSLFSIVALFFYSYHANFYFGTALNYINADSKYYLELSQQVENLTDMIRMFLGNKNLFGQLIYYDLILQESRIAFFIFNVIILVYLFHETHKNLQNQRYKNLILFLLLINPAIVTSLSGPNKEITGFISILFIINYMLNKKNKYIFIALIFAFFTRFELMLVIFGFILFRKKRKNVQYRMFVSLIILISLVIYFSSNYGFQLFNVFEERTGSLGFVWKMAELNQYGLYIVTFMPKLLLNLFGDIIVKNMFEVTGYSLFTYVSQLLFIVLIVIIIKKKRINLNNQFFLFFLIYSLMFTIPAFIQHRYFLPSYPILIFLSFYKNINNERI